ncbi:MAG TPA: ABC transporter substrate-binding protein, partial [Chloroflexota bacterium]
MMIHGKHVSVWIGLVALVTACAGPASQPGAASERPSAAPTKTSAILGISAPIPAFSFAYLGTSGGGAQSFNELWQQGLVTSGTTITAPEPRIAAELPSIERGTAQVLPDGRLKATWKIRPNVQWADGTDLTAQDFVFGLDIMKDKQNPLGGATLVVDISPLVESIEVVDAKTFTMNWIRPFYQFDALGFFALQPVPTHVLRSVWDERNLEGFANHPYWRGDYFQVGPYRPTKFEPQVEIVLEAVPNYFLGRPKLDTITIKQYSDSKVLYAAVLAKAVDITADNSLQADLAMELKDLWDRSGEGAVYVGYGTTRGIFPMFEPAIQMEPAMLDPRARQALYTAVDRESWTGAVLAGRTENSAYSMLPPDHRLFEFTKDSVRSFQYDPARALRQLADLGWERGADGTLRNRSDGRAFKEDIWTTQDQDKEAAILGDLWHQIGIDGSIFIIPNARQGDRELRQSYPGVEITARGYGDHLLTRAECATVPRPPRYEEANRGHYCNPDMDRLIAQYRGS